MIFFWAKLTTDLKPDTQNTSKNALFIRFPQHFGCAKFLGQKITRFSKILVKNRFYRLFEKMFLLFYNPSCCVSQPISTHKPRMIDELMDDLSWTLAPPGFKIFFNGIFCIFNFFLFFNFMITVFATSTMKYEYNNSAHVSDLVSFKYLSF